VFAVVPALVRAVPEVAACIVDLAGGAVETVTGAGTTTVGYFLCQQIALNLNWSRTMEVLVGGGVAAPVVVGTDVVVTVSAVDMGACEVEAAAGAVVAGPPSPRSGVALTSNALVILPKTPPSSAAPPNGPSFPKISLSLRSTHTILLDSKPEISASPSLPSERAAASPSNGFRRKRLILILKDSKINK
jgi:hypothetical protein